MTLLIGKDSFSFLACLLKKAIRSVRLPLCTELCFVVWISTVLIIICLALPPVDLHTKLIFHSVDQIYVNHFLCCVTFHFGTFRSFFFVGFQTFSNRKCAWSASIMHASVSLAYCFTTSYHIIRLHTRNYLYIYLRTYFPAIERE